MILAALALVTITVLPSVCFDPCEANVTLTVEKAPDNYKVVLELASDDSGYYRNSELGYDEKTPKVVKIRYVNIPAGTYQFKATLFKAAHTKRPWIAAEHTAIIKVTGGEAWTLASYPPSPLLTIPTTRTWLAPTMGRRSSVLVGEWSSPSKR